MAGMANLRRCALTVATVFVTSVLPAAELVWPTDSAGDLSIFLSTLRFRIYSDHCSTLLPELKPGFESVVLGLNSRIEGISKDLLASDMFKDMRNKAVQAEILDAFRDSFDDVRHNLQRADAASVCPMTLRNFGQLDDESLKAGLVQTLTAVQTMERKLEEQHGRQASSTTDGAR
jgi:hypothetical protein